MDKKNWTRVLVLAIIFGFLSFNLGIVEATESDRYKKQKYYSSICIEQGDTLWSIAKKYADEEYQTIEEYIKEIKQINGLTSERIVEGNYLIISYYHE